MTVRELATALQLEQLCEGDLDRTVETGYCGDLLSWVMGRAPADSAWFTVMSFLPGGLATTSFASMLLCRVRSRIWLPESFVSVWVLRTMTRGSPRLIRLQGKMSVRR